MSTDSGPDLAARLRAALLEIVAREVTCPRVLDVMRHMPRHAFVPEHVLAEAYADYPLPIGHGATISQPTVVGMMSQALALEGTERILEIGTGSGYQAAVLSRLARHVDTIEVVPELAERARRALEELGITNVDVQVGDGWSGLPDRAPFDRIVVTAAPDHLPEALVSQLVEGGFLVVPVGPQARDQRLERHQKRGGRLVREDLGPVRFVPMVRGVPTS
jgi:protein-L-isoaspartate(D-aspartate) O-methyltransferase